MTEKEEMPTSAFIDYWLELIDDTQRRPLEPKVRSELAHAREELVRLWSETWTATK